MRENLLLLLFLSLCLGGGWLLVFGAFRLRPRAQFTNGLAAGIVVNAWLANLLGQVLPVPLAFWLAPALTLAAGVVFAWPRRAELKSSFSLPLGQLAAFALITGAYFLIGRGLAIFDDYQNLPMVSLLAAGEIPPRFALDPSVRFGYHHLLLLFAAQIMRVGDVYPWAALDLARALVFALTLLLVYNWTERFTRSRAAGFLAAAFTALGGGARWLLLFIPQSLAPEFAANIQMIGSGAASAPDVMTALRGTWAIEGGGPLPFPFAFANGVFTPAILSMGGVGLMGLMVLALLLTTHRGWVGWQSAALSAVFIAALALLIEVEFVMLFAGFGLITLLAWMRARRMHFSGALGAWVAAGATAGGLALVQGGVLTEVARGLLQRATATQVASSYHSFNFGLAWPPGIVSAHLGALSLANPYQAAALLAEVGPILLALPLLIMWGIKMARAQRWFETAFIVGGLLSLLAWLLRYEGTAGVSATGRLYAPLFKVALLYAVPLVWLWARRSDERKIAALSLGGLAMLGGVVMLGVQMIAIQKPVYSYFLRDLDVQVMRDYYNRLETNALIFDPIPPRAPTLFGRYTDSSQTWYVPKEAWLTWAADPDPYTLRAAGFDYAYLDAPYWDDLSDRDRDRLQDACVQRVFEYTGYRNMPEDYRPDFRWLLDLRDCQK